MKNVEKDISKRLKALRKCKTSALFEDKESEVEALYKELCAVFTKVRESLKNSFDTYIDTLCSFSQTKGTMERMKARIDESYNDCSPIIDKKFDLLLNFNKLSLKNDNSREPKYTNEGSNIPIPCEDDNNPFNLVKYTVEKQRSEQAQEPKETYTTPIKPRRIFPCSHSDNKLQEVVKSYSKFERPSTKREEESFYVLDHKKGKNSLEKRNSFYSLREEKENFTNNYESS